MRTFTTGNQYAPKEPRTDPTPEGIIRNQPPNIAMFGVKCKALMMILTIHDLNGIHLH